MLTCTILQMLGVAAAEIVRSQLLPYRSSCQSVQVRDVCTHMGAISCTYVGVQDVPHILLIKSCKCMYSNWQRAC